VGTDVLDFAGLDAAASAVETAPVVDSDVNVDTTVDSTVDTNVDSTKTGDDTTSTEGSTAEGDKSAVDAQGKPVAAAEEDLPGTEKTPSEVRKALKAFKDSDPKNAAMVKQLHGAFERHLAYQAEFPTVEAAREAKTFLDSMGGYEGFENLQNVVKSVEESDQLLYAGDGKLIDNIYDDMKTEGKQDAFGKLASPFLDKLKDVDKKAFYATLLPHNVSYVENSGFPNVVNALAHALEVGDEKSIAEAKAIVGDMSAWFKDIKGEVSKTQQGPSPAELALKSEREKFTKEQEEFKSNQTKEFYNTLAKEAQSSDNKKLGAELSVYLNKPYFKPFKDKPESLKPLAKELQFTLQSELEKDKAYQLQMKTLRSAKTPDKAKILQYHTTKVESLASRIVRDTVQRMYPNYTTGGSAAGRIAATQQKKAEVAKNDAASASAGAAQYVAVKPKNLNREMDPKNLLEIAGKGYVPNGRGGWRLVSWRKPMV
jgi:hypothetical protein